MSNDQPEESLSTQDSRGKVRTHLLLWEVYLRDFDTGMVALMGGGGLAIFVLGALSGATGAGGPAQLAFRGGLLAVAIALAAGAIGAFVGFLFGLPRTLTSNELRGARGGATEATPASPETNGAGVIAEKAPPAAQNNQSSTEASAAKQTTGAGTLRSSYSDVNTNLEQISDWLTKIIVGVGLTQLNNIPRQLDLFGQRAGSYFAYNGKALSIATGLFALILGFFLAYVGTRVRLSLVFTASQRNNDDTSGGKDLTASSASEFFAESAQASPVEGAADPGLRRADAQVLSESLTNLTTVAQLRARANALARAARPREARDLYEHILKLAPATPDLLNDYAQVLSLAGDRDEAQRVLGTAKLLSSSPDEGREAALKVGEADLRGEILAGLYGRSGKTYQDSITALASLASITGDADPWVHIWAACAHGQRYAAFHEDADRAIVGAEVRRALEIDPSQKGYLASLYDPALVRNDEDDLASLHPDPILDALLLDRPSSDS